MRHKYLTPWQAIGYALQWWDNRKTLDKTGSYSVSIFKSEILPNMYTVVICAPWNCTFDFSVFIDSGRWHMFNSLQYHFRHGTLGLYKRQDLRALFLWAQRIMEHSATI